MRLTAVEEYRKVPELFFLLVDGSDHEFEEVGVVGDIFFVFEVILLRNEAFLINFD